MALLKVSNVSKSYDGRKIIDNINLELNKGEIVSLLGVSGVGKTTLFQVISGLVKPDNGTVEVKILLAFQEKLAICCRKIYLCNIKLFWIM